MRPVFIRWVHFVVGDGRGIFGKISGSGKDLFVVLSHVYSLKYYFVSDVLLWMEALVLFPLGSVVSLIGKQLMWLSSFLFLRGTPFVMGGEM